MLREVTIALSLSLSLSLSSRSSFKDHMVRAEEREPLPSSSSTFRLCGLLLSPCSSNREA